jgi:hypothetical protein
MGGAWKLRILPAAVACALLLAACGGGGSSTEATTAEAEATTPAPGAPAGEAGGGNEGGSSNGSGKEGGSSTGGAPEGGGSATGPGPKKGERSYSFRTPGGDNSIQEYGNEGKASERSEAENSIEALYAAFSSGNWAEVCSKYLSSKNVEEIKILSEKSPQVKGSGCAGVLSQLNTTPSGNTPDRPKGGVASLRIEGDTAFAIYRGADGKGYALPLKREEGVWKLTALGPTPLGGL